MTLSWRLHRRHTFTVSKLLLMLRMSPEPRDHFWEACSMAMWSLPVWAASRSYGTA